MITVFFDFETGGIRDDSPSIQLAAIAVNQEFRELGSFEQKIAFDEAAADPQALAINHYDRDKWTQAKPPAEVARLFAQWLRPFSCVEKISRQGTPYSVARLAGHNAAVFDGPRLRRMFEEARMFCPVELHVRDTLQRALWWFDDNGIEPASFRLTELCKHFRIPVDGAHDALTDVRLAIAVSKAMNGGGQGL
jgi:DNA polymerase III epsilon subunit-like protein